MNHQSVSDFRGAVHTTPLKSLYIDLQSFESGFFLKPFIVTLGGHFVKCPLKIEMNSFMKQPVSDFR